MRILSVSAIFIAGLLVSLSAFTLIKTGSIQGKLMPADGAIEILAVNGADTLRSTPLNGNFMFKNIKTGTYTILVKANAPYHDVTVDTVPVVEGASTDVGLIKLLQ